MNSPSVEKIIDGKALALNIREGLSKEVATLAGRHAGKRPGLATVLVGQDPASAIYVRNKIKACKDAGIETIDRHLAAATSQEELLSIIDALAKDERVHGILVQLPLPAQISVKRVLEVLPDGKDVDGFGVANSGKLFQAKTLAELGDVFIPCTPYGVLKMLESIKFDPSGKEVCVIGRSNIVGKPMAHLLTMANATVTICHSKTKDIAAVAKRADLIVAAIGKAKFVTADMVKDGAVVIDVGMNRLADSGLVGDCDYKAIEPKARFITPVPGGVGPMTIAMLLYNTVTAFKRSVNATR